MGGVHPLLREVREEVVSSQARPIRVLFYDDTETTYLGASWRLGALLFSMRGAFDLVQPVTSWEQFCAILDGLGERSVKAIQLWGHGRPGAPLIANRPPNFVSLSSSLERVRYSSRSSVWFRSCNVATGTQGREWMGSLACEAGLRVAGHTFIIGPLQSGLRVALPDDAPSWSATEGLNADGSLAWSSFGAPRTVTMFAKDIPDGWVQ